MNESSIKNFFNNVLKMPHYSNSQQNPEHENAVRLLLEQEGFQLAEKPAGLNKKKLDNICLQEMKTNEFLYQPVGSQNSPDFIIKYNNKLIKIECKSSKNVYPVYNSGRPKPDVIYIFSSAKYNKTTIFYGEDVLSKDMISSYDEMLLEIDIIIKKYKQKWKLDPRGFDFYLREMYVQSGGEEKINYFKHSEREKCEQRILNEFTKI